MWEQLAQVDGEVNDSAIAKGTSGGPNFKRIAWLSLIFGASPALCKSFLHKQQQRAEKSDL